MIKSEITKFSVYYRIKLKSHLENKWSNWFEGMVISHEGPLTVLTGQLKDQSALHGILNRIRDLNLTLVSVEKINSDSKNVK
jgi:hypothetical protein